MTLLFSEYIFHITSGTTFIQKMYKYIYLIILVILFHNNNLCHSQTNPYALIEGKYKEINRLFFDPDLSSLILKDSAFYIEEVMNDDAPTQDVLPDINRYRDKIVWDQIVNIGMGSYKITENEIFFNIGYFLKYSRVYISDSSSYLRYGRFYIKKIFEKNYLDFAGKYSYYFNNDTLILKSQIYYDNRYYDINRYFVK